MFFAGVHVNCTPTPPATYHKIVQVSFAFHLTHRLTPGGQAERTLSNRWLNSVACITSNVPSALRRSQSVGCRRNFDPTMNHSMPAPRTDTTLGSNPCTNPGLPLTNCTASTSIGRGLYRS